MINNRKGFTLVELVVVMGVVVIALTISSFAFQSIVRSGSQQVKSAETQITGQVGLEMMRAAIGHAGYGLFWAFQTPVSYTEVTGPPVTGLFSNSAVFDGFNDNLVAPRAVVTGTGNNGSYLVIKSTLSQMTPVSRKWSFFNYSTIGGTTNASYVRQIAAPDPAWAANDRAVVVTTTFASDTENKTLAMNGTGFFYTFGQAVNASFLPVNNVEKRFVYGVATQDLRMPYNRTDFYIDANPPQKPLSCNPGTGVLYMALAGQNGNYTDGSGTNKTLYPLMDCVGDMRVAFDMVKADGTLVSSDTLNDPDAPATPMDAAGIRSKLKNVRIYLLAQEGKKDPKFSYPSDSINVGTDGLGKTWSASEMAAKFGSDWRNYRWKLYYFAVNLKNLQ